ncbi:MAG: hypothetical protein H0T89_11780 [Deltaproteobacteria bacterium]|nr:hypothetical protein [Deltaproteobacteria bacterium]MDQ3297198.1 hypothetical protein [Myxococcota bacterium]
MRWWLLLGALCGCDAVFGLDGTDLPECELASFRDAQPVTVVENTELFSWDRLRDHLVIAAAGTAFELDADSPTERTEIALEPNYPMTTVSLAPEGDQIFFTASIEPSQLFSARRDDGGLWHFDRNVPDAGGAGTPTLALLGPRRILVRVSFYANDVQEYEEQDDGTWKPVGDRHVVDAVTVVNLSSDGLTMVYDGFDAEGQRGVFAAQRPSRGEWFRDTTLILAGTHPSPQLADSCDVLHAIDEGDAITPRHLVRYQR